ncbi:nucleotide exchange factor GrpE [Paenibacillus pini]|uniref:Protein GrpE n=1 Tax=Paenibacillus pini JCM 16418 TaxID=1236976 RepID=W7Y7V6_9BACL|nr:nucleotide exchange factor GrpE [Paenibacillus pini]GAF07005.1 heat shock protein GrpE [Paenibacillus pini JCM 16418]
MKENKHNQHEEMQEDINQSAFDTDSNEQFEQEDNGNFAENADESNVEVLDSNHLQGELERYKALADENQQRALRTQADFDNFRKRTQKEKEDFAKYASTKLITELLPIVDNFERALAVAGDNANEESLAKGVSMIFRQLEGVLQSEGLTAMDSVGQPFNPEFHQAIMQVESEEYEEGIVAEEVQKGYMLKDKVLRPAMVKVSM